MKTSQEILKQYWGYDEFRPFQKEIIDSVLEGKDTIALLPTGGGKSICFQIPALLLEGVTVVVSPLISLIQDQVKNLKRRGVGAAAIHSGTKATEVSSTLNALVFGQVKILYVSPERLMNENFIEYAKQIKVSLLVIDEAHCVSQWGHDFRPAYQNITAFRSFFPVPVLAVTATATESTLVDIEKSLELKECQLFQSDFFRPNLSYSVFFSETKPTRILEILSKVDGSAIVYVRTRKETIGISRILNNKGIKADFYHGGLNHFQRTQKQDRWTQGKSRVMVATNAFGMGIDKPDVRVVIHSGLPDSVEGYFQESGRAGRDGLKAYAVLLFDHLDVERNKDFIDTSYPKVDVVKRVYQALANFFRIAVGTQPDEAFEFDIKEFCEVYRFEVLPTFYVLKLLEKEGLISFNESYYAPSKVQVLLSHADLYGFQVANKELDSYLKLLLRMYGASVFDSYQVIDEKQMGVKLNLSADSIRAKLKYLHKKGVIDYIMQNDVPLLFFTLPRKDAGRPLINEKLLKELKKEAGERVEFISEYVGLKKLCRVNFMLGYCSQTRNKPCGICDNCLESARQGDDINEVDAFYDKLPNEFDIQESISGVPESLKNAILEELRKKIDQGELSRFGLTGYRKK